MKEWTDSFVQPITRRDWLRKSATLAGAALLVPAWAGPFAQQAPADPIAKMRADIGSAPIEPLKLTDSLTMLSGPGGNVVVLNGTDGKIVVDSFVQPAWPGLKQVLDGLGNGRITTLIDTHWHFDHSDNNENFRKAGASILAHGNTKKRLTETHELLGMRFLPVPDAALPTETFSSTHSLHANGEQVSLGYIQPAHTDTDISIRFAKGNVLHLGDVFFNGTYPFIDGGTGGSINGMIRGVESCLKLADNSTKIVPGHGPLGNKAALTTFRDMLVTVRDRVEKLKTSGRTLEQVIAENPTKEFDPTWGKGFMPPAMFIGVVFNTLR